MRPNNMPDRRQGRFLVFLRRRGVEVLAALYFAIIVYNSLMPLDFSAQAAEEAQPGITRLFGLPVAAVSIPDAVSNLFFYIPMGGLLCATLVRMGWGRWLAVIPTVLIGAGLSYLMELTQAWSATRVSSVYDLLYNIAGTSAGAIASRPLVLLFRHYADKLADELRDRPSLVVTALLGVGLVGLALLPLDITFSVDRVKAAVKSAHVVPFDKLWSYAELAVWEGERTLDASRHILARNWWMLFLDYIAWGLLYAVLALAACYYLRAHCRMGPLKAGIHALTLCAMYSVVSSVLQFFIITRGLDLTVLVFQLGGALLAVIALQPIILAKSPVQGRALWALGPAQSQRLLMLSLVVVAVGVVLRETVPFHLDTSPQSVADQFERVEWLPMEAYQEARFHVAVDDISHKVLRYMVLGGLAAALAGVRGASISRWRPWQVGFCAAICVAGLELAQIFLPSRVPGISDVLMALFGAAGGVYAFQLGRLWWYDTRVVPLEQIRQRVDYRVELGSPDDQDAPRERVPTPVRRRRR